MFLSLLYSRSVGVCAWGDGARGRRLQHLRGAHHHVKLTWDEKRNQELRFLFNDQEGLLVFVYTKKSNKRSLLYNNLLNFHTRTTNKSDDGIVSFKIF